MLNIEDFSYIYQLIERANVQGAEAQKVVDLKMKIINFLKSMQEQAQKANPAGAVAPKVEAKEEVSQPAQSTAMSNEAPANVEPNPVA